MESEARREVDGILADGLGALRPSLWLASLVYLADACARLRDERCAEAIYPELARSNNVPLVPSLLAGVGGIDSLNQPDGIHPTPAGHAIMAATVWRTLQPLLVPAS